MESKVNQNSKHIKKQAFNSGRPQGGNRGGGHQRGGGGNFRGRGGFRGGDQSISGLFRGGNQVNSIHKGGRGGRPKQKLEIKFDPKARKEFLTGFKKRKDERRAKAKELIKQEEKKIKEENRLERQKYKESINEQYENIKEAQKFANSDIN